MQAPLQIGLGQIDWGQIFKPSQPKSDPADTRRTLSRPDARVMTPTEKGPVPVPHRILPLNGGLKGAPVFNSNQPEPFSQPGILLSTMPQTLDASRSHLDFAFTGQFDIFAHHKYVKPANGSPNFHVGLLLHNPSNEPVTVIHATSASYTGREAPFEDDHWIRENNDGSVFSGPGDRAADDFLRGKRISSLPDEWVIQPGQTKLIWSKSIPDGSESSSLFRFFAHGSINAALVAETPNAKGQPPSETDFLNRLKAGNLSGPRNWPPPSRSDQNSGVFVYGRVAGVSNANRWEGRLSENDLDIVRLPEPGGSISFPLNNTVKATLGTKQNQTAQMQARYPDAAYEAHANYGLTYDLTMPLRNTSNEPRKAQIWFGSPLKFDGDPALDRPVYGPGNGKISFRGTIRLDYPDESGVQKTKYVHVIQPFNERGPEPLLELDMPPGSAKDIRIRYVYPADATPPHVLTLESQSQG